MASAHKAGRKRRCAAYRAAHTREKNKVKRGLQSSGERAAREYAQAKGVGGYLDTILKKK